MDHRCYYSSLHGAFNQLCSIFSLKTNCVQYVFNGPYQKFCTTCPLEVSRPCFGVLWLTPLAPQLNIEMKELHVAATKSWRRASGAELLVGHPGPPTGMPTNIKSGGGEGGAAGLNLHASCSTKPSGAEFLVKAVRLPCVYGPCMIICGPYMIIYGAHIRSYMVHVCRSFLVHVCVCVCACV